MRTEEIVKIIKKSENEKNKAGMARYGINTKNAYGVSIYQLRPLAKEIGKNHELALDLWKTEIHEARILAGFIDEPEKVTEIQMEEWVKDFDSWDLCDQVCSTLFDKTKFAHQKIAEWSRRKEEFVKRAGFVLIAALAVHDKKLENNYFEDFLKIIKREANDERNFVKKAVNWALRNIGKRNKELNEKAVTLSEELTKRDSKTARWIGKDALRELTSEKVRNRLTQRD